ncbi:class F sortase [Candidatus Roizmanbacteria bacterium]|nr:class F sortase [Candidatus Roizmanbacteria bacterium]
MKYTVLVTIMGLIAGGSIIYHAATREVVVSIDGLVAGVSQQTPPTSQPKLPEDVSIVPVYLDIARLGLSEVVIEHVGLDNKKRMDVPADPINVAWFEPGYRPGENGSAVLAGHFDLSDGSKGVFADIGDLENGDTIEIFNENGEKLTFQVVDTQVFLDAEFPIDLVFGESVTPRLNLITCAGTFDPITKNYSHRLVVFTELVQES